MSDWTYEMLRYAFSWNEESADKALKYVVNSRSTADSMSEFQLLDILLLTILTEKDEVERTSALVFLEEHGRNLVFDYTRLHKVYFVLDNILGSPVDGQSMTYSLKSQVLVTYTALLIQFNCFETDVPRFEGFVDLLFSVVKHTNKSADRMLRAYACECLHELESWYPGLLFPLLGEDWSMPPLSLNMPQVTSSVGPNTLGRFVNDELLHVHETYSRLFFTTFQHFTEQVVQEALRHQANVEAEAARSSMAATPLASTPPTSRPGTPPLTPRLSSMESTTFGTIGTQEVGGSSPSTAGPTEVFRFNIPEACHSGPEVAFDLAPDQTPPRLPRKLVRTMTRSISLVLETMPTSSSWTKIFFAERLSLFIRILALPCRVVFHHFSPMLHASRPSLLHAFLVVTSLFAKEIESSVSEAVVHRLFLLTQDTALESCFRSLAINWLIALSESKPSTFDLLWDRVTELCPRWHDPLELKEMKLQALLYCFKNSQKLPRNLLVVLEALSEFKYCCRPVGAHAVMFRFLLRVVVSFAPEMDRLEVPQFLCDLLRSHPRLLPSVLCVERRANSEAVQYKLLHSFGDFVSRLEPPSRVQSYFGLLATLAETPWLDPGYVLAALRRLVFCPSSTLTWQVGMQVLITCRRVILSHPQAEIYQPMLRLLHHLATYQSCVDLRDRALLYLRLLTHAGSASLGAVFHPNPGEVERMTMMLTPVLPKTIRLLEGPVPFLQLSKSLDERKKLGIHDRQCAVFVLPAGRGAPRSAAVSQDGAEAGGGSEAEPFSEGDWERRWGDRGDDHQFPEKWRELADLGEEAEGCEGCWSKVLKEYREHLQVSPSSLRLPFVLEYKRVQKMATEAFEWLDCPRQLFSLELTFSSSSEHFVPIDPIRIPFIANEGGGRAGNAVRVDFAGGPLISQCRLEAGGFPRLNKLLLKLQPISPVPTSFSVDIAFNDCLGNMYFGQLETFTVAFQDMFLPVRLPPAFWSKLFESLWKGDAEETCWSVKVLDLDRKAVRGLISTQLEPFIVHSEVDSCMEEDFDFEQEEYFEHGVGTADGVEASCASMPEVGEVQLHVEIVFVIIFIPPCNHLLLRFAISSHSTIVRILTDRFQLLSYLDGLFLSWSRGASLPAEGEGDASSGTAGEGGSPSRGSSERLPPT